MPLFIIKFEYSPTHFHLRYINKNISNFDFNSSYTSTVHQFLEQLLTGQRAQKKPCCAHRSTLKFQLIVMI